MHNRLQEATTRSVTRWITAVDRQPRRVLAVLGALTVSSLCVAGLGLGMNADTVRMVGDDVPSARLLDEFAQVFPILDDAVMVVVDGETPQQTRDAAQQLAERLRAEPERYRNVFAPGIGEFFERNGLLYLSLDELYDFSDQIAELQPLIAELERDPSIATLADLVEEAREEEKLQLDESGGPWIAMLRQLVRSTESVHGGRAREVPWETLFLDGTELAVANYSLVLLEPVIDRASILETRRALAEIRETARELGITPENGLRARVTGHAAINQEEIIGFLWDLGVGGIGCLVLVMGVLYLAFHSWNLVAAAMITLVIGLLWTAAAAAVLVGDLNIISMSFAILFIGLGVDFAIHLGMVYASLRYGGTGHREALVESVQRVGWPLVICAFTTAIGFFVFVPTPYRAISELGLVAGAGMAIILFLTLTLLPALLSTFLPVRTSPELRPFELPAGPSRALASRHGAIRIGALLAAAAALALLPRLRFEPMITELRDPSTESVQAFQELVDLEGDLSPMFADVLAPDLESAEALSRKLESLPRVSRSVTINRFVPERQEEKRTILEDVAFLLDSGQPPGADRPTHSVSEQEAALARIVAVLEDEAERQQLPELRTEIRHLAEVLSRFLAEARERGTLAKSLETLEEIVLAPLPRQLERMRVALAPDEIALETLPDAIVERQIASDGRVRVTAFPAENLRAPGALERFVAEVQAVAPNATGMAPNLAGFARTTIESFQQALLSALALILVLLGVLWLRWQEPLLVMAPLLLGSLLLCGAMVLLGLSFNFGNVLVIPLLLGAGVDSGIHLVQASAKQRPGADLLASVTARAVLYSAITTITSFGALGLSGHIGMASLGKTLTVGMVCMLIANLVVLPALLSRWKPQLRDL